MIASNGSAALARDLGGHSSVAITNNYLHTTPEERRAAGNSMSYASMLAESRKYRPLSKRIVIHCL